MEIQLHAWERKLTPSALLEEAREFATHPLVIGPISGPRFGDIIEDRFREWLQQKDYHIPKRGSQGDLSSLGIDIKALQVKGKRGGAAKIHGYNRGGPPAYSLLLFTYRYQAETVTFEKVYYIPAASITWVRAEHYLFSLPDRKLAMYCVS